VRSFSEIYITHPPGESKYDHAGNKRMPAWVHTNDVAVQSSVEICSSAGKYKKSYRVFHPEYCIYDAGRVIFCHAVFCVAGCE